jgi:hypothetical protein
VRESKAVMAGREDGESGRMPSPAFIATAARAPMLQDHHAPGSENLDVRVAETLVPVRPPTFGHGLGVSGPSSGSVEGSRRSGSGVDGSREGLVFGSREGLGTRGGCFGRVGFRFGVRRLGFLRRGPGVRLGPGPGVRFGVGFVGAEGRRRVMAEVASDSRENRHRFGGYFYRSCVHMLAPVTDTGYVWGRWLVVGCSWLVVGCWLLTEGEASTEGWGMGDGRLAPLAGWGIVCRELWIVNRTS